MVPAFQRRERLQFLGPQQASDMIARKVGGATVMIAFPLAC